MRRGLFLLVPLLAASPLPAQRVKLLVPLEQLLQQAQQDSNDAVAHYDAALGLWLKRDYAAAERHLREAIAIEPAHASAYLALSYLPYARRSKLWDEEDNGKVPAEWQPILEEAWRFRREAFLIDPMVDLKPVALMIPPTATFGLSSGQKNVYTYLMNGFGSFWVGDYATASAFFKELTGGATEEQHSKFGSWFLWYEALAAAHSGDYPRAISNLEIMKKRAEADIEQSGGASLAFSNANHYRYTLATLLDLAGREKEAVPLLEEALTVDAGLYYGHTRLAAIYAEQRRTGASLQERRRAITANPDNPVLLYDLGEALARAGELPEAYSVLLNARKANPRNARAHYIFGWVAQQLNEKEAAREAYTTFLAMAPSRFSDQKAEATKRLSALQ
jgi:tetratricopeptide (TPR) repeat protein